MDVAASTPRFSANSEGGAQARAKASVCVPTAPLAGQARASSSAGSVWQRPCCRAAAAAATECGDWGTARRGAEPGLRAAPGLRGGRAGQL